MDVREITVSTRLDPEIKRKLAEKALSDGLDICGCLRKLVYQYLGLEFPDLLEKERKWRLLEFGLQIGDYKMKSCVYNINGICEFWYWREEDLPKDIPVKFVMSGGGLVGKHYHSEALRERCVFCYGYEEKNSLK